VRVAALADLHGHFPKDLPDVNVVVVAGDIALHPVDVSPRQEAISLRDQYQRFRNWTDDLNHARIHVVYVAGNHDFAWHALGPKWVRSSFGTNYLLDSGTEINGVKFYGSPWQPWMGGWAFNAPEDDLNDPEEKWLDNVFKRIPTGTDVLITHTPPAGFHDTVKGTHRGSISLNKHVERVLPKLHIYGHIHKPGVEVIGNTVMCNAAYVGFNRRPNGHPIQVFDI
jgi:Icc-related predicted phosphoesterase